MHAIVGLAHVFMGEPASDDELMALVQSGASRRREEAFRMLVQRHARVVTALVRSVLGREGVDDVTQETFLRVYEARERYVPGRAPFRAWLLKIARNLALNTRRGRALRSAEPLEEDPAGSDLGPAGELELRLDLEAVSEAVSRLPAGEREVIALRFQEGLSYEEIGAVTGSSAVALKQKTWRALERLRAFLGEKGS
jgi:RNA polymerase sigma-70 factor (ECF subfamily)